MPDALICMTPGPSWLDARRSSLRFLLPGLSLPVPTLVEHTTAVPQLKYKRLPRPHAAPLS